MTQLLQTTLIISLSLIFYRTLLEKETHYQLNRWVLLSCMILAFVLPQIPYKIPVTVGFLAPQNIQLPFPEKEIQYTPQWESVDLSGEESHYERETEVLSPADLAEIQRTPQQSEISLFLQNLSLKDGLIYIYILGVIAMSLHFLIQLASLIHQIKIHPKNKEGKYILVELLQGKASYSFFNFIFINSQPLDDSTYQQILSHERIHVDQKHSWDILLSEVLLISQWFNPFAWLFKKKVKQNLEYLTDDLMVRQGTDITDYQFSLLRVSAPDLSGQLVLNYSQSLLKKRILMMNTKKSPLSTIWKYLLLLPLLALSSLILVAEKAPEIPQEKVSSLLEQAPQEIATQTPETIESDVTDIAEEKGRENPVDISAAIIYTGVNEISGSWEGKLSDSELCLRIFRSLSDEDWNWVNFDCFEASEFSPEVSSSSTSFSLNRKAGSLNFTGSFSGKKGEGDFEFKGSESYQSELKSKGIKTIPEDLLFRLFFKKSHDRYIENLIALQDLGLDEKTLQVLMVDGVKAGLVKEYQDAGLSVSEHLRFVRSRVKASLIKSYQDAGLDVNDHKHFVNSRVKPDLLISYKNEGLDLEEHKGFINSRVKPDLLANYKKAGFDLEEYKMYIHSRVKPELLKEYQDAGLDVKEYDSYINSRVKPALLTSYKEAGFDPSEYTTYIHSRVKPSLLKSYQEAGLDIHEHDSYIQSRVKPEILKEYQDAGYDLEAYKTYIHSRVKPSLLKSYEEQGLDIDAHKNYIHSRVKPELIKAYKDAGFSPDEYGNFIQSRVKPSILTAYKNHGFDLESHKNYIHSRVKPELLKSYRDAGLDLDEHKNYIHSRVDPAMLTAYKEAGFDLKTYNKYIHSRVKPSFLKAYKEEGLDIKKYDRFVQSRVSAEFLKSYIDAGYEPKDHEKYIHMRIKASFLKRYEAEGLDIDEHEDFILERVAPEKVKKYREAQKNKN